MEKEKKEKLLSQFKIKCRNNKLKVTPQRTVIYEELISTKEHPSVDILYKKVKKRLPDISFDTVYRTLTTFFDLGIASVVEGICSSKRYEGNTENHYHFICTKCGNIFDIEDIDFIFDTPDIIEEKYHPRNVRIIFEGNCKSC
jgi:Fur family transcriptional regulator, peroxide stress response regulator